MALFTSTDDVSGILPEDYASLIVQPTRDQSIALHSNVSSVLTTGAHDMHIPIVTDDGDAGWYEEGQDLTGTDGKITDLKVTPAKIGRVRKISNELADDSSPEAQEIVGQMIGAAIARGIDLAFFGDLDAPAPKGLASIAETVSNVNGVTEWDNLDPFAEAISKSEENNGIISAFVANPADSLALMRLKRQDASNEPLLGLDATSATSRLILGVPLLVSPAVEAGTIWGLDRRFDHVVLRKDVELEVSRERYFETDQTAVKGIMRIGWGFTHPKALTRITLAAA